MAPELEESRRNQGISLDCCMVCGRRGGWRRSGGMLFQGSPPYDIMPRNIIIPPSMCIQ